MKIENDIKNLVNQNFKLLELALKANQELKDNEKRTVDGGRCNNIIIMIILSPLSKNYIIRDLTPLHVNYIINFFRIKLYIA